MTARRPFRQTNVWVKLATPCKIITIQITIDGFVILPFQFAIATRQSFRLFSFHDAKIRYLV